MPTQVGIVWIISASQQWLKKDYIALENNVKLYDFEGITLWKGLETALAISQMQSACGIYICLDNLSVSSRSL